MSANITDIAKRLNLSHSTVSRVLNRRGKQFASEETSRKIWLLAEELNYRPNRLANALLRGKTHVIGVLMGRVEQAHSTGLLEGIRNSCLEHDYQVLLGRCDSSHEDKQARLLLDYKVDGLICVVNGWRPRQIVCWLDEVISENHPCVIIDSSAYADRVDCVISDDFSGAKRMTTHLIELGHRRIAHISGGTNQTTARDRQNGYIAALAESGIPLDPELIKGDGYSDAQAAQAMKDLLRMERRPSAVFVATDRMAYHAWRTAEAHGVRIPDDMALVGYGNLDVGLGLGLSTIDQFPLRMGQRAVDQILSRMKNRAAPPSTMEIETDLIIRHSSGVAYDSKGG